MTSHALLLRLFLSSSFFSVHVALRYLLLYADNIGITYYLTYRLRELDVQELTDVWGFICHLLVTRPTKSRALECFVVDIAQRSTHISLITLWFMQATLGDLSRAHRDSQSFAVCQRVLLKCHEIVFGDLPPPVSGPYAGLNISTVSHRRKVKHHAEPIFVGVGTVLAGAIGMPSLTSFMGEVAIEQGRVEEDYEIRNTESNHDLAPPIQPTRHAPEDQDEPDSPPRQEVTTTPPFAPKSANFPSSGLLTRRRTIAGAQTVPALPLHLRILRKSTASDDPLGQFDIDAISSPYQSSPSLPSARTPLRSATSNPADVLLEQYDQHSQSQLLRSHFCLSEVQFLLSLETICNRLLIVPRPARVSALRAELTALNHKLPAEVCLPLWCSSSETSSLNKSSRPHHRIVRIPPGESVVLNSAERAPYLLLVEILNSDLDFDPSKKINKDVLRKIVVKDHERRGSARDSHSFGLSSASLHRPVPLLMKDVDVTLRSAFPQEPQTALTVIPATPSTAIPALDIDEEIDLVEQVYGTDQPLLGRITDISESIVLPPTPKNKDLDLVTWSRASSIPPSAAAAPFENPHAQQISLPRIPHDFSSPFQSQRESPLQSENLQPRQDDAKVLSLDEYSERMRTAAIMLAQLNANLVQPVPPGGSPRAQALAETNDPLKMKQSLSKGPEHSQSSSIRMKVNQAEASAIRDRIMKEMLSLEEERMARMRESDAEFMMQGDVSGSSKSLEDEGIIRRELNKVDPSAVVFSESWATKKSRIRHGSPYGHLAQWDCISVIVKTGGDLRQEQLAVQLIREFQSIWAEEKCACWVKHFDILITGSTSGLIETIKDAVSIHSIKKAEYAKRLAEGRLGHVTLLDHFKSTYGDPSSAKFARAQRNFAKSLAGYCIVTFLLQVKDRHNGNILLDRDGHLIHIDFGFILSNTPGNIGFEAAPFKFPPEYLEVLGGLDGGPFLEFKRLFREGFETARKHCDRIITLVELMQKDSAFPCFVASGEQTASQLRDRFQPTLTHSLVGDYVDRLIASSLGSHWTRLYDSYQYYSQSIL